MLNFYFGGNMGLMEVLVQFVKTEALLWKARECGISVFDCLRAG